MDRCFRLYKTLLIIAFVGQLLIDVLGYKGVFYSLYDEPIFIYAGHGSLLPFKWDFSLYIAWALLHYIAVVLLYIYSKLSIGFAIVTLVLSFILTAIGGIWVATPLELIIGWLSVFSFDLAFAMALFYPPIKSRIHKNVSSENAT